MTHAFTVKRNMRGDLEAETDIELDESGRVIRLSTSKRSGGSIATYATVGTAKPAAGSTFASFSFVMFQDFNKAILTTQGRATEKTIAAQHQQALAGADALKADVAAFYADKSTSL